MAKIPYQVTKLSKEKLEKIGDINRIIQEYQAQGLKLTLRQLYYQLVSRDMIPNKQTEYSKLSTLLKEARMNGLVDWAAIEDRLRVPYTPVSFEAPIDILEAAQEQYEVDLQDGQPNYIEVWVEKDALSGVLRRVTKTYHVPILVNRGYSSVSAMHDSFLRMKDSFIEGRPCYILYLGDFDPSGLDMIRDIRDRLLQFFIRCYIDNVADKELREAFADGDKTAGHRLLSDFDSYTEEHLHVVPVALTREQIDEYEPPENPAKLTDPRAGGFVAKHGYSSWEVDALRPEVLNELLSTAIKTLMNVEHYEKRKLLGKAGRDVIRKIIGDNEDTLR